MRDLTHNEIVILYANGFDEVVAATANQEFSSMGLPVMRVGIQHQDGESGACEHCPHKHTLQEVVNRVERVACLVIPTSISALGQFKQQALLWQLVDAVSAGGAPIVIGPPVGAVDPEVIGHLPPSDPVIVYQKPTTKLVYFFRWLAHTLATGDDWRNYLSQTKDAPPLIYVAAESVPSKVAGAIAGIVREHGYAEAQAIGPSATSQMFKALSIAKSYLASSKMALFAIPDFKNVQISGKSCTANRLFISAWPAGVDKWSGWGTAGLSADD